MSLPTTNEHIMSSTKSRLSSSKGGKYSSPTPYAPHGLPSVPTLPVKAHRKDSIAATPYRSSTDDASSSVGSSSVHRFSNNSSEHVDRSTANTSVVGSAIWDSYPSSPTTPFDQARLEKLNSRLRDVSYATPDHLLEDGAISHWDGEHAAIANQSALPISIRPPSTVTSIIDSPRRSLDGPGVAPAPENRIVQIPETAHARDYSVAAPVVMQEKTTNPGLEPRDMAALVTKMQTIPRYEPETELRKLGKRDITRSKWVFTAFVFSLNFLLIFATWWWPRYYYIFLPLITFTVALNCLMCISLVVFGLWYLAFPEKIYMPETPENLVFLMPCYNETKEECTKSLDSLVNQIKIDEHKRSIMIICDGRVRGPGMEKTTAQYLLEDILVERTSRKLIRGAYMAWDHVDMDVEIQKGMYKGVPYFCIIKQQNQGKRDGLIVLRSFLYNFNRRSERPEVIFSPRFFGEMASFLANDAGIDDVTHLIGMDADTVFADDCIYELLQQSRYKDTVGVCGYVAVDFSQSKWSPWALYQSSEYTISQGLRRLHQSKVTNKVSCLPGCCQLLRICETTCGDKILVELFGYCPKPHDGLLKQIRATASEDRNHVCLMLTTFPNAKTRQALKARAYTDVPRSWAVFLSQRRRWTLGATANDLMLIAAPGINWFERILAFGNCLTWTINVFIMASLAGLIKAILHVEWWIILAFASVMMVPMLYYICIVFWLPPTWLDKFRYILGFVMYVTIGMFLNIFVLFYAVKNVDSFGWGKTRQVVAEDPNNPEKRHSMDEESMYGVPGANSSTISFGPEILAVLPGKHDAKLLDRFGRNYRTLALCANDEQVDSIKEKYASRTHTIEATTDASKLASANVYVIPVNITSPTDLHEISDMATTLTTVSRHASRGDTIILTGVLPVGQTRAMLSVIAERGIACGFSPTAPVGTAKVVAALDDHSLAVIDQFYGRSYPDVVTVPWVEVAEMWQAFVDGQEGIKSALQSGGKELLEPEDVLQRLSESFGGVRNGWDAFEKATTCLTVRELDGSGSSYQGSSSSDWEDPKRASKYLKVV